MQQEKAGLRGDANLVLLFNDQSAAAFKPFFRQKYLNVSLQFTPVVVRQTTVKRAAIPDNLEPLFGKWGGPQFFSSQRF